MTPPITSPGIYPDITAADYHADPVAVPSLSSTIAKLLVSKSPKHAWLAHPRLGGAKEEGDDDEGDPSSSAAKALGEVLHQIVLRDGMGLSVICADNWRTAGARLARDHAIANGCIPVLDHKLAEAYETAKAMRTQLDDMGLGYVFRDGLKEVVIVWEEDGIWCRAMLDNLIINEATKTAEIWDLKTCGRSSHPAACSAQIDGMGYDLSLAFYKRGLAAVRPDLAGRIKCRWAFLEVNPPYATTPVEINGEWEMVADHQVERAIALWRKSTVEGKWPFYVNSIVKLEPKPWKIAELMTETQL